MRFLGLLILLFTATSCSSFGAATGGSLSGTVPWGAANQFLVMQNKPGLAARASASVASSVGVRWSPGCISATISANATAQPPIDINLVTGSTTYVLATVSAAANTANGIFTCDLRIPTLVGTPLRVEFSGVGAAATQQNVLVTYFNLK